MSIIRLHGYIDICIDVSKYKVENKQRFIAKQIGLLDKGKFDLFVYEYNFADFIELLNCFVSNLLDTEKEYSIRYKDGFGYVSRMVSKQGKYSLSITSISSGKQLFLSKYDCKVIVSNFNKIYSRCTRSEFLL